MGSTTIAMRLFLRESEADKLRRVQRREAELAAKLVQRSIAANTLPWQLTRGKRLSVLRGGGR